eukprot:s2168_g17.t1
MCRRLGSLLFGSLWRAAMLPETGCGGLLGPEDVVKLSNMQIAPLHYKQLQCPLLTPEGQLVEGRRRIINAVELEIVIRLTRADISLTTWSGDWVDDSNTIAAAKLAGRDAAEEIAHREFEESEAADEFAERMQSMAEMCGSSEGRELAREELAILKDPSNVSQVKSQVSMELAAHVEQLCQVQVLDADFFVSRLRRSSLIGLSLLSNVGKEAKNLDYAKSALVLHDKENSTQCASRAIRLGPGGGGAGGRGAARGSRNCLREPLPRRGDRAWKLESDAMVGDHRSMP